MDKNMFINSYTSFVPTCFIVTATYAVGLELSTEKLFQPIENILSETKVVNSKIESHLYGLSLLNRRVRVDNAILILIILFNKQMKEISMNFEIENYFYTFSLTISFNIESNCVIFTLMYKVYFENTKKV